MNITDFSTTVTSSMLNESMAKAFGEQLNLKSFTRAQLEDGRNLLRTRVAEFEMNESFGSITKNNDYQKTRMLLDIINTELLERELSTENTMRKSKRQRQPAPHTSSVYFDSIRERAKAESIPSNWVDSAINRITLGESTIPELKAELMSRYDKTESTAKHVLCESEETKAEIIIATKDMVDRITGWIEDVAAMKAEQFLELVDSIREQYGNNVSQKYSEVIRNGLDQIYLSLEQNRNDLNRGLAIISGNEVEPSTDLTIPSDTLKQPEPEPAPAPRETRESVEYRTRLAAMLSSKKN